MCNYQHQAAGMMEKHSEETDNSTRDRQLIFMLQVYVCLLSVRVKCRYLPPPRSHSQFVCVNIRDLSALIYYHRGCRCRPTLSSRDFRRWFFTTVLLLTYNGENYKLEMLSLEVAPDALV